MVSELIELPIADKPIRGAGGAFEASLSSCPCSLTLVLGMSGYAPSALQSSNQIEIETKLCKLDSSTAVLLYLCVLVRGMPRSTASHVSIIQLLLPPLVLGGPPRVLPANSAIAYSL